MNDTADTIIEAIRAAFAAVPPGAITIHEAEVIDSYGNATARAAARRRDTAASWSDVADADIEACRNALPHLDPEGWRFYIPAYMVWSLRNERGRRARRSDVLLSTVYSLCPSDTDAELRKYALARFRLLTDAQAAAVCRFLRYLGPSVDSNVSDDALRGYWGRYCEGPLGREDPT